MKAEEKSEQSRGQTFLNGKEFITHLLPNRRLLGIDLGTKTIGLALSDVLRNIASAYKTLSRSKFSTDVQHLKKICLEFQITGLVIGLPKNMDGTEGPRAQSSKAFARNFNKLSDLPVLLWDERLSTMQAERMLISADLSRARRSQVIDKLAATIILQSALDFMSNEANSINPLS